MPIKCNSMLAAVATLILSTSSVLACPANPPGPMFPGAIKVLSDFDPGPTTTPLSIEIDGFTAIGSQSGDSCGAAPALPDGLALTAISMVHSKTGKPVGFGKFKANARATRGFCGTSHKNCMAFVAKVTKDGVKEGTPMKMVIKVMTDGKLNARRLSEVAMRIAKSAVFTAGGVDRHGNPHHHLSVFRLSGIEVQIPE